MTFEDNKYTLRSSSLLFGTVQEKVPASIGTVLKHGVINVEIFIEIENNYTTHIMKINKYAPQFLWLVGLNTTTEYLHGY